jgi:hypothetical protein
MAANDLQVEVVAALAPRQWQAYPLTVEAGTTVAQALQRSGALATIPTQDIDALTVAVWGRKAELAQVLREADRVELLRPLRVDPKLARRLRFTQQGSKTAGLFARRKPSA